jgi:acetyl-CoA acetyltransferase
VRTPVGRRGGGLAGAHPADLGAHVIRALLARTGVDPLATLLHALVRTGGRYGMVTMCEGGGQANVTILERC